mgnify:CR=1 FL=1
MAAQHEQLRTLHPQHQPQPEPRARVYTQPNRLWFFTLLVHDMVSNRYSLVDTSTGNIRNAASITRTNTRDTAVAAI